MGREIKGWGMSWNRQSCNSADVLEISGKMSKILIQIELFNFFLLINNLNIGKDFAVCKFINIILLP